MTEKQEIKAFVIDACVNKINKSYNEQALSVQIKNKYFNAPLQDDLEAQKYITDLPEDLEEKINEFYYAAYDLWLSLPIDDRENGEKFTEVLNKNNKFQGILDFILEKIYQTAEKLMNLSEKEDQTPDNQNFIYNSANWVAEKISGGAARHRMNSFVERIEQERSTDKSLLF